MVSKFCKILHIKKFFSEGINADKLIFYSFFLKSIRNALKKLGAIKSGFAKSGWNV